MMKTTVHMYTVLALMLGAAGLHFKLPILIVYMLVICGARTLLYLILDIYIRYSIPPYIRDGFAPSKTTCLHTTRSAYLQLVGNHTYRSIVASVVVVITYYGISMKVGLVVGVIGAVMGVLNLHSAYYLKKHIHVVQEYLVREVK